MGAVNALSRRAFLSLAGATMTSLTAGCAGMGGGVSVKSGSGPIAFWSNHPGQSTAVERELIARFQGQFPGLSVKLIDAGKDYDEVAQKFNAALIGTDVPDVVVLDDIWWSHFALSGVIAHWMTCSAKSGWTQGITWIRCWPTTNSRVGTTRCPTRARLPLFYYNKPLWEAAGLPTADRLPGGSSTNGARSCSASSATEDRPTAGLMPSQFPGRSRDRTGHSAAPTPTSGT